jgi:hypothetical protein
MADQTPAEEHQKKLDAAKRETELATAAAAAAEAKKKEIDAKKALAAAERTPSPEETRSVEQSTRAKSAKEVADAEKAEADARKAASEADLAAVKAAIGDVPSSGITGTVTPGEKAGDIEAALLAMKAVRSAAAKVAMKIPGQADTHVVMMTPSEMPTFQNLMAYDAQLAIINATLDAAIKAGGDLFGPGGDEEAVPALGAAGLALDGVSKLLSFFRSDITIKGVELTIDDRVGLQEVANALAAKQFRVTVPAIYNRGGMTSKAAFVIMDGTALSTKRAQLAPLIVAATRKVEELTTSLAAATTAPAKTAIEKSLIDMTALLTSLKNASTMVDGWYTGLSATDAKGVAAVVNVAKEKAIADSLGQGALLLLVKVEKAGGAFVTKKNLWTFFGTMPIYHMGGAALSFTLVGGSDGAVKAAGVFPIHGGFIKAGGVAAELER